jgi:hypothetical protein
MRLPLAFAALLTAQTLFAESTQVRTPVNFTLGGCSALPSGLSVSGTGESFMVLNTRTDNDGNIVIEQNTLTTGTAIDSNGATYTFNYHSHATITTPPTGVPFSVRGTDHFNLVGDGKANQLQVHFVATATVTSLTPFVANFTFINIHGDPFTCDPI